MVGYLRLGADPLLNKQKATPNRRYAIDRISLVEKFVTLHHQTTPYGYLNPHYQINSEGFLFGSV